MLWRGVHDTAFNKKPNKGRADDELHRSKARKRLDKHGRCHGRCFDSDSGAG